MINALVTGASGFIGSHLVEALLARGYRVRVLLRPSSSREWLNNLPIETATGDLFSPAALEEAVKGMDYVYHSAGITKARTADEYYRGNAAGTRNILQAVRQANPSLKRFVQISSQAAVGPSPPAAPVNESALPRPITAYGRSKWEAERECHAVGSEFPITIVRPPAVFGPRDKDIFEFFRTVGMGLQPMVGFAEKEVSLIHVGDLVRGFILAGESQASTGKSYFISSERAYGWREIGDITSRVMGKRVLRLRIPEFAVYGIAVVAEGVARLSGKVALINLEKARDMVQDHWTCDSSAAKRDFGYAQEIPLAEGIASTVAWYREHGWLK
jgi:nucleoside-diphosphate-sugar epimerase